MGAPSPDRSAGTRRRCVVVGVDGSAGAMRALDWATEEAACSGAMLEIHTAYGLGYVLVSPHLVKEAMKGVLDEAIARVKRTAPEVETVGVGHEGSPVAALVEASKHADLLVVGSRGHGDFAELLLGSVSRHCVMHAFCPVVVVRHSPASAAGKAA